MIHPRPPRRGHIYFHPVPFDDGPDVDWGERFLWAAVAVALLLVLAGLAFG